MFNRQQKQVQLEFNLQITDDTWERLLCALERLEYVTEGANSPNSVATRLDNHRDKGNIQESAQEIELEVQLQIQAFKYVVAPVRQEATPWLVKDFACWMGARKVLPLKQTDEYAIPVLQCILGEKFNLPEIKDLPSEPLSEKEVRETAEQLGAGLHKTDRIEAEFTVNPGKKATQHSHERGSFQEGMDRIKDIAEQKGEQRWFKRLCDEKPWSNK
jgi:hypothetical protein